MIHNPSSHSSFPPRYRLIDIEMKHDPLESLMIDPLLVAIQGSGIDCSDCTKLAIRSYAHAFHQNAMKFGSRRGEGRSSLRMIAFGSPENSVSPTQHRGRRRTG